MSYSPLLSGRQARRMQQFGKEARRKGAGWTRPFRKGREQRLPKQETKETHEEE